MYIHNWHRKLRTKDGSFEDKTRTNLSLLQLKKYNFSSCFHSNYLFFHHIYLFYFYFKAYILSFSVQCSIWCTVLSTKHILFQFDNKKLMPFKLNYSICLSSAWLILIFVLNKLGFFAFLVYLHFYFLFKIHHLTNMYTLVHYMYSGVKKFRSHHFRCQFFVLKIVINT